MPAFSATVLSALLLASSKILFLDMSERASKRIKTSVSDIPTGVESVSPSAEILLTDGTGDVESVQVEPTAPGAQSKGVDAREEVADDAQETTETAAVEQKTTQRKKFVPNYGTRT